MIKVIAVTYTILLSALSFADDFGPPAGGKLLSYCSHSACMLPSSNDAAQEIALFEINRARRIQMIVSQKHLNIDAVEKAAQFYREMSVSAKSAAARKAFTKIADAKEVMVEKIETIAALHIARVDTNSEILVILKDVQKFLDAAWHEINLINDVTAKKGAEKAYASKFFDTFVTYWSTRPKLLGRGYVQTSALKNELEVGVVLSPTFDLLPSISQKFLNTGKCELTYTHGYKPQSAEMKSEPETSIAKLLYNLDYINQEPVTYETSEYERGYFEPQYHEINRVKLALSGNGALNPITVVHNYLGENPSNGTARIAPRYDSRRNILTIGCFDFKGWGHYGVDSDPNLVYKMIAP